MKFQIPNIVWMISAIWILSSNFGWSQIQFKIELLTDENTYQVSMIPEINWVFPLNLTSSAQITVRVPHGDFPNSFVVENLTALQVSTSWDDNTRIDAPSEAPNWDYISFALISMGTAAFDYQAGVEIPVFSFTNGADACTDSIELVNNLNDPFLPPNSWGANIGHSIVTLGGGLSNAFSGVINTGKAPCVPITACEEMPSENAVFICEEEPFNGYFYQNDTVLIQHFLSSNGCDSMATTEIFVSPIFDIEDSENICLGELFNGQTYFQDTDIEQNLQTIEGCDSTVLIHLTVLQPAITNIDTILCHGDIYKGQEINTDTMVIETINALNGCDSIIYTQIEIININFISFEATICAGDSIFGSIFVVDTLLEEVISAENGCDSIVIMHQINVLPASQTESQILLIIGDTWQNFTPSSDTSIIQYLTGLSGCDSTAIVDIFVFPEPTNIIDTVICSGQVFNDFTPHSDTILIDTLTAPDGSFNLTVYNLTVLPTKISTTQITLCAGNIFMGTMLNKDTVFTEIFNDISFCDSIAVHEVSVIPTIQTEEEYSICKGELFEGIFYQNDTVLIKNLMASAGCDSLVLTYLEIWQIDTILTEIEVCKNDFFNNQVIQEDTIFNTLLTNQNGCDSLIQDYVKVLPNPEPEITKSGDFCENETIELTVGNFTNYEWNTGSNQAQLFVNSPGNYAVTVTNPNNCTGEASIELPATEFETEISIKPPLCGNPKTAEIIFNVVFGGTLPYVFSIDNGNTFQTNAIFTNLLAGNYDVIIEDADGCQHLEQIFIPSPEPLIIQITENQLIELGDSLQLILQINRNDYETITWQPSETLSCSDCLKPIARPFQTTNYRVHVTTNDCEAETSVMVTVAKRNKIFLPNIFSPNNDGHNDRFYLQAGADVESVRYLRIFNRNGALVFERKSHLPNNPLMGWNGVFKGDYSNIGTYVYVAEVELINGKTEIVKGDFILIR